MKHRDRITALTQVERLHNMLTASRRDMNTFARRNREYLDENLAELAKSLSSLQPKPKRKPKSWDELRPQDVERITNKLSRLRGNDAVYYTRLLQMGFVGRLDEAALYIERRSQYRRERTAGYNYSSLGRWTRKTHLLPEFTPKERLDAKRRAYVGYWGVSGVSEENIRPEFIRGLHPDDASWIVIEDGEDFNSNITSHHEIVLAAEVIKINKTLLPHGSPQKLLAAQLYMQDHTIPLQVYYCAAPVFPRDQPPRIEKFYLSRVMLPQSKKLWVSSKRFKNGATAFTAARDAWTAEMSKIIYTEEGET